MTSAFLKRATLVLIAFIYAGTSLVATVSQK
jgi:hypothetical protein